MQAYSRKLKLRLAWWIIWWSLCALLALIQIPQVIDIIRHPYWYSSNLYILAQIFWMFFFVIIVLAKFPGMKKLLTKDSLKGNVFAKAILLEGELKKQKSAKDAAGERDAAEEKIKVLQKEIEELKQQ